MLHQQTELDAVGAETAKRRCSPTWLMVAGAALILSAAVPYLAIRWGPFGRGGQTSRESAASFRLNLDDQLGIDPRLIRYEQVGQVPFALDQPRAIACGLQDQLYVAGDLEVQVFSSYRDGPQVIRLDGEPTCLAVGGPEHVAPGRLYVGSSGRVVVFDALHHELASWPVPARESLLTSLALAENEVLIADAGNRVVWRFSTNGELLGEIGKPDAARGVAGFVVPSPHFDLAMGSHGLVHVVNPGKLQVTTCTMEGDFGDAWGRASAAVDGFFGCCNPTHIAVLTDGSFVTAEKGIPRIKTYDPAGNFQAVVAGPRQLGLDQHDLGDPRCLQDAFNLDLAVDSQGRVLVLDAKHKLVRIFQEAK